MSLNKVITVTFGILLISGIFTATVLVRPLWMKIRDPFNSTVYNSEDNDVISIWNSINNTVENNFWLLPAVAAIIILAYVFMSLSEEEYITAGGYRR